MNTQKTEMVQMSDEERSFLMRVYEKRRKILIRSYIVFVPVMMIASVMAMERHSWYDVRAKRWYERDSAYYMERKHIYLRNFCVGIGIFSVIAVYMNRASVRTVKQDSISGMKRKIPYTITRKQYFPLTNQYFVWTGAIENPDHEVDEATYYNCSVGDSIYVYQAPLSKLIFEKDGRHEVI